MYTTLYNFERHQLIFCLCLFGAVGPARPDGAACAHENCPTSVRSAVRHRSVSSAPRDENLDGDVDLGPRSTRSVYKHGIHGATRAKSWSLRIGIHIAPCTSCRPSSPASSFSSRWPPRSLSTEKPLCTRGPRSPRAPSYHNTPGSTSAASATAHPSSRACWKRGAPRGRAATRTRRCPRAWGARRRGSTARRFGRRCSRTCGSACRAIHPVVQLSLPVPVVHARCSHLAMCAVQRKRQSLASWRSASRACQRPCMSLFLLCRLFDWGTSGHLLRSMRMYGPWAGTLKVQVQIDCSRATHRWRMHVTFADV